MALKIFFKRIVFFLVAGILLLSAGLALAYSQLRWEALSLTLTALGVVCLLVMSFFWWHSANQATKWVFFKRKFFVVFGVLVFTVLFILLNYLGAGLDRRFDLTRNKQHTLLAQTVDLIQQVKDNVQITVFYVGIPPKYLEDLLKAYERHSKGRIHTEIVDPLVRISYAAQFGKVIDSKQKRLIVRSGGERKDVDFSDKPLNEEQINNAILQVTRKARTACFVSGDGESPLFSSKDDGYNRFVKHLLANNIIAQTLFLGTQDHIPDACRVLVVAGPHKPLSAKEEAMIQAYLKKGGDALLMVENTVVSTPDNPLTKAQMDLNPSLNELLHPWGLEVEKDVVVDIASHASGDVGSPATKNYLGHKAIVGGLDFTFFVRPRSIKMLKDRPKNVRLAPLILTSSAQTSWGETNRYLHVKFDPDTDRPGPVPIAFAVWQPKAEAPGKVSDTRMIVITDADFLSNAFIDAYSNAQLGVNMINWLSEKDYKTFLSKKKTEVIRLDLTSQQKRDIVILLSLMLAGVALAGLLVWLKQLQK